MAISLQQATLDPYLHVAKREPLQNRLNASNVKQNGRYPKFKYAHSKMTSLFHEFNYNIIEQN